MTNEEAIKWIDDRMCFGRGKFTENHPPNIDECWKAGRMAIKALMRTGWIPVSERLPEDGVAVLTTTENEEVYIDQVITDPYKERYFQSNTAYDNFQVIAWMPLPEPYKGGDAE